MQTKLPQMCAAHHTETMQPIMIVRGVMGYYPARCADVHAYNAAMGVTKAQVSAMLCGCMFGWDAPGANPARFDAEGHPLTVAA